MDLIKNRKQKQKSKSKPKSLETSNDHLVEENSSVLLEWQGPEYENYPKDRRWYITAFLFFLIIVAYALITNNPIMAITFILIGIVGYIHIEKEPRILTFKITKEGIVAGNELYDFDDIESFWIFYEPPHTRTLSIRTSGVIPHIHFPIHQVDPTLIRKTLFEYIPEKKQEPTMIDTLSRLFHI